MRLEPSLNVTPEGSLADIPAAVDRERKNQVPEEGLLGTSLETRYMEIPDTCVKTVPESSKGKLPELYREQKKSVGKKQLHQPNNFLPQWTREIQVFQQEAL